MMKRVALPLVVVAAVLALGGLAWWLSSTRKPVQAASAARAAVREYVDEQGVTRLDQVHKITMPYAGRIEAIRLEEGDPVRVDQPVAVVAEQDRHIELAEAGAAVDRLEASLAENADVSLESSLKQQAELFVASMEATVQSAEARMTASRKRMDFAETILARTRRLFQTRAQSQEDLDRADVQWIESQVEYQQDNLILQASRSIEAATKLLPQMVSQYIARKQLTGNVLQQQKEEAEARLDQVRLRDRRGRMVSPVDGVVLKRSIRDEQFLGAGAELLEIGDLRQLEIEADILSQEVVRIREGQPVEVYGPAIGRSLGAGVPGQVHRVSPAGFTKKSSLGVDQQRVKIVVRLQPDDVQRLIDQRRVGVGYRVRVRVFTAEKADAVSVPRAALFRGADGGRRVYVVRRGRARLQEVEVGLINDDTVEIVRGVAEGELVVLAPENSLNDGDAVSFSP